MLTTIDNNNDDNNTIFSTATATNITATTNKNKYSQTCSNNHLYKMITHPRQPMVSLPKQIPIQLLLYKTTICLK